MSSEQKHFCLSAMHLIKKDNPISVPSLCALYKIIFEKSSIKPSLFPQLLNDPSPIKLFLLDSSSNDHCLALSLRLDSGKQLRISQALVNEWKTWLPNLSESNDAYSSDLIYWHLLEKKYRHDIYFWKNLSYHLYHLPPSDFQSEIPLTDDADIFQLCQKLALYIWQTKHRPRQRVELISKIRSLVSAKRTRLFDILSLSEKLVFLHLWSYILYPQEVIDDLFESELGWPTLYADLPPDLPAQDSISDHGEWAKLLDEDFRFDVLLSFAWTITWWNLHEDLDLFPSWVQLLSPFLINRASIIKKTFSELCVSADLSPPQKMCRYLSLLHQSTFEQTDLNEMKMKLAIERDFPLFPPFFSEIFSSIPANSIVTASSKSLSSSFTLLPDGSSDMIYILRDLCWRYSEHHYNLTLLERLLYSPDRELAAYSLILLLRQLRTSVLNQETSRILSTLSPTGVCQYLRSLPSEYVDIFWSEVLKFIRLWNINNDIPDHTRSAVSRIFFQTATEAICTPPPRKLSSLLHPDSPLISSSSASSPARSPLSASTSASLSSFFPLDLLPLKVLALLKEDQDCQISDSQNSTIQHPGSEKSDCQLSDIQRSVIHLLRDSTHIDIPPEILHIGWSLGCSYLLPESYHSKHPFYILLNQSDKSKIFLSEFQKESNLSTLISSQLKTHLDSDDFPDLLCAISMIFWYSSSSLPILESLKKIFEQHATPSNIAPLLSTFAIFSWQGAIWKKFSISSSDINHRCRIILQNIGLMASEGKISSLSPCDSTAKICFLAASRCISSTSFPLYDAQFYFSIFNSDPDFQLEFRCLYLSQTSTLRWNIFAPRSYNFTLSQSPYLFPPLRLKECFPEQQLFKNEGSPLPQSSSTEFNSTPPIVMPSPVPSSSSQVLSPKPAPLIPRRSCSPFFTIDTTSTSMNFPSVIPNKEYLANLRTSVATRSFCCLEEEDFSSLVRYSTPLGTTHSLFVFKVIAEAHRYNESKWTIKFFELLSPNIVPTDRISQLSLITFLRCLRVLATPLRSPTHQNLRSSLEIICRESGQSFPPHYHPLIEKHFYLTFDRHLFSVAMNTINDIEYHKHVLYLTCKSQIHLVRSLFSSEGIFYPSNFSKYSSRYQSAYSSALCSALCDNDFLPAKNVLDQGVLVLLFHILSKGLYINDEAWSSLCCAVSRIACDGPLIMNLNNSFPSRGIRFPTSPSTPHRTPSPANSNQSPEMSSDPSITIVFDLMVEETFKHRSRLATRVTLLSLSWLAFNSGKYSLNPVSVKRYWSQILSRLTAFHFKIYFWPLILLAPTPMNDEFLSGLTPSLSAGIQFVRQCQRDPRIIPPQLIEAVHRVTGEESVYPYIAAIRIFWYLHQPDKMPEYWVVRELTQKLDCTLCEVLLLYLNISDSVLHQYFDSIVFLLLCLSQNPALRLQAWAIIAEHCMKTSTGPILDVDAVDHSKLSPPSLALFIRFLQCAQIFDDVKISNLESLVKRIKAFDRIPLPAQNFLLFEAHSVLHWIKQGSGIRSKNFKLNIARLFERHLHPMDERFPPPATSFFQNLYPKHFEEFLADDLGFCTGWLAGLHRISQFFYYPAGKKMFQGYCAYCAHHCMDETEKNKLLERSVQRKSAFCDCFYLRDTHVQSHFGIDTNNSIRHGFPTSIREDIFAVWRDFSSPHPHLIERFLFGSIPPFKEYFEPGDPLPGISLTLPMKLCETVAPFTSLIEILSRWLSRADVARLATSIHLVERSPEAGDLSRMETLEDLLLYVQRNPSKTLGDLKKAFIEKEFTALAKLIDDHLTPPRELSQSLCFMCNSALVTPFTV